MRPVVLISLCFKTSHTATRAFSRLYYFSLHCPGDTQDGRRERFLVAERFDTLTMGCVGVRRVPLVFSLHLCVECSPAVCILPYTVIKLA